ncbi:MAG TPA: MFS transporter [Chloroflexota bacterium]|nr:MFS transporter [Chloroflexota bacterium]
MFTVMGARATFAVLYPAIVIDLGWSVAEVTTAFSAGLLVYPAAVILVGVLVDRLGCRATMLGGCGLLMAGMALLAVSTELWQFYVAFIVAQGLGCAGVGFVAVVKMLAMRYPRRFAAAFGLASVGQGLGSLLISPAVQAVIDLSGWRAGALTFVGVVGVGVLPLVILVAPGREPHHETHARATLSQRPTARSWLFLALFVSNAALGYQMLLPTHQVAHLLSAGFAPMSAATTAGLWGACGALSALVCGWALERWREAPLLALAAALYGLGIVALITSTPDAAWLAAVFVLGAGLGRGILGITLAAVSTRAFAGPRLGRITGLLDLGFGIGAFLGPWLTAVVHDQSGSFGPGLASGILAACVVSAGGVLGIRLAARASRQTMRASQGQPTERAPQT